MELGIIAAGFSWGSLESWWAIIQMIAGLGFVIFVHELGHFLVAKACGVKCEKFYVGFDMFDIKIGDTVIIPRTLLKKKWGETEYGIGIVPLGGYVKMLGQDDNPGKAAEEQQRALVKKEGAESSDEDAYELDPRSFQAKSVLQRMAIISAGVVMNLIFAVIFAAIAYGIGVEYQPAVIGGTVAGGPAWENNIRPGDRVVSVDGAGEERKHLRFYQDVSDAIMHHGDKFPMPIVIQSDGDESSRTVEVLPSVKVVKQKKSSLALIGISPEITTVLADEPTLPETAAAEASKDEKGFKPGDKVIKLDDLEIETISQMRKYLAINSNKTVLFTVQRKQEIPKNATEQEIAKLPKVVESFEVKPNRAKTVGLVMKHGPILAIQKDSPAANAGLKVGDKLIGFNNGSLGNPQDFYYRLRPFAAKSEPVQLKVLRNGDEQTITVKPREPYTSNMPARDFDNRIAVDELGIAFAVTNVVESVEPGSSADKAGMIEGDVLVSIKYQAATEEKKKQQKEAGIDEEKKPFEFADAPNAWPYMLRGVIQYAFNDTKIIVTYTRSGQEKTADLIATYRDDLSLDARGIRPTPNTQIHVAKSFPEAVQLGFRKTKEDGTKIYSLLYKLFSGQVSPVNLGGPFTIASAATHSALGGPAALLMFLTLLSVNLAIVNFLPIPVLDGGHMVFLIWEAIFRRPVNEKMQIILSVAGLIFLVGLMLSVFTIDIWRFFV